MHSAWVKRTLGGMNKKSDPLALFRALHGRRVWSVAVAYLVVGFGLVEASELVFSRLQLPAAAVDVVLAVLLFAFPVALLLAWKIGTDEEGIEVPAVFPLFALLLVGTGSVWLGVRALQTGQAETPAPPGAEPLVVLMDSPHPARVYDEETRAVNGTNADVLSDILLDLPIRRQRESIGPDWHRDEEILQFDPDLIVIHYSGFRQEDGTGPRARLKLLISYFAESDTRFLVYSRANEEALGQNMRNLLSDLEAEYPGLMSRMGVFGLLDYGPPSWLSPLTANPIKLRVKETLGL